MMRLATFDGLTAVLLKVQDFWGVNALSMGRYRCFEGSWRLILKGLVDARGLFNADDEGAKI